MFKRVFILGAGSNVCYGFPTGGELRNFIINKQIQGIQEQEVKLYDEFREYFRESGMQSVDRFLEQNDKYQDIGKKVIAWFIASKEDPNVFKNLTYQNNKTAGVLREERVEDHWYFYLFNRILQEIHTLEESEISFITFNYDRSLEYFLYQSLSNTFLIKADQNSHPEDWKKEANQLRKYWKIFNIQHVYGQIGPLLSAEKAGVLIRGYSLPEKFESLNYFYQGIHLVENRHEDPGHIANLKKIVKEADIIYCIGFGFDGLNMERIGLSQEGLNCKAIFSTSVNLGLAERIFISSQLFKGNSTGEIGSYDPQKNTTNFLRDLYVQDNRFIDIICRRARREDSVFIL